MPKPKEVSFSRYLAAKRSVDDRALNLRVWNALAARLAEREPAEPLQVIEIGAGIGTMIERVVEWDLIRGEVVYTALDAEPQNIDEARRRLPLWAARRGLKVVESGDGFVVTVEGGNLDIRLIPEDLFKFAAREAGKGRWDLLIANAFMDVVNIPDALAATFGLLKGDGHFYFTITFDGLTAFEPPIDPALDEHIIALYHADMEARRVDGKPTGGSRAGRRLLRHLLADNAEILATGASDWIVHPKKGAYPEDEATFLRFIIDTIGKALSGHAELDDTALANWLARRHTQIGAGELTYIAHQIDILGVPAGG